MEILEIAYELYKLEWLQEFVSPQELFDTLKEYYDYVIEQTKENKEVLSFDGWLVSIVTVSSFMLTIFPMIPPMVVISSPT